jgi:hypothetical protein
VLQVSNSSDRLQRVELQVFRVRQVQGRSTADLTPCIRSGVGMAHASISSAESLTPA